MQFVNFIFSLIGCIILSLLICNVLSEISEKKQREKRNKKYAINKFLLNLNKIRK